MTLSIASPILFRSILQRSRPELRFYIDAYALDLIRTGIERDQALRRARIEFGSAERAERECRDATPLIRAFCL
jgi:hypothetical protein